MDPRASQAATAFLHGRRIVAGHPADLRFALAELPAEERARLLIIDDATGESLEMFSGDDPHAQPLWPEAAPALARGRPKLGVKPREVTLLPRHWEWLSQQPGGASAAIRRLVDAARATPEAQAVARRNAIHKAMLTLAGDQPGYGPALKALFAGDEQATAAAMERWPADIRDYLLGRLAQPASA